MIHNAVRPPAGRFVVGLLSFASSLPALKRVTQPRVSALLGPALPPAYLYTALK